MDRSSPHPGRFDPQIVGACAAIFLPQLRRMWPETFHGTASLPEHDRVLVVANHSGLGVAELALLHFGWHERFGDTKPLACMVHPRLFGLPGIGDLARAFGCVEATYDGAATARRGGSALGVFPGGGEEAARPFWQADQVDFRGRKGWLRLARAHGLTVVPLCISGSHRTTPILARGRAMGWILGSRFVGLPEAPLPLLSAIAAAAALAATGKLGLPLPARVLAAWASLWATLVIPWVPSRIGFHFLAPISPDEIAESSDSDLYERVVGTIGHKLRAENERDRSARRGPRPYAAPATG